MPSGEGRLTVWAIVTINLSNLSDLKSYTFLFFWGRSLLTPYYSQPWLFLAKFSSIFLTHLSPSIFFSLNLPFPSYISISDWLAFLNPLILTLSCLRTKDCSWLSGKSSLGSLAQHYVFQWSPHPPVSPPLSHLRLTSHIPRSFPVLPHPTSSPPRLCLRPLTFLPQCFSKVLNQNFCCLRDSDVPLILSPHPRIIGLFILLGRVLWTCIFLDLYYESKNYGYFFKYKINVILNMHSSK